MNGNFKKRLSAAFAEQGVGKAELFVYDSTDSTNTRAKLFAKNNLGADAFFIAEEQTGGRGRLGRSFLSERGGLYMSYLFHPELPVEDAIRLTAYAAVVLTETIRELCSVDAKIKWVNDCYVGERKLAGILTEGEFSERGDFFKYAVVGIGLNVLPVDFGEGLSGVAVSLSDVCEAPPIEVLAARLAAGLSKFFESDAKEYMKKYREYSMIEGKRIRVIRGGTEKDATALSVNEDASLTVRYDDGQEETLTSGDVSIKFKKTI